MVDDFPEGWYVPIQRALTRPDRDYLAGVPFGFAVLNGTWTLALTLGGQKLWVAPIGLLIHAIGVACCKADPHFFDVLKEHVRTKGYYGV